MQADADVRRGSVPVETSGPLIDAGGIRKQYGDHLAVRDVSLTVAATAERVVREISEVMALQLDHS